MTITPNVSLHDGGICYNQSIELTCHASDIRVTTYKWTSSKSNQSEETTSITVTATDDPVEYTCTANDSKGNSGHSSVNISSDGKRLIDCGIKYLR